MLANLSCFCSLNPSNAAALGYTVHCSHTTAGSFGRSYRNSAAGHSFDCCIPHTTQHLTIHLAVEMAVRPSLRLHFRRFAGAWLILLLTRAKWCLQ